MIISPDNILGIRYAYNNEPRLKRDPRFDLEKQGANCELVLHLVFKELGIDLPEEYRSLEIFQDNTIFLPVTPSSETELTIQDIQPGDVFMFGPKSSAKYHHVGVYTGKSENKEPVIIHGTKVEGKSVEWRLGKFGEAQYAQYHKLDAVKRLDPKAFEKRFPEKVLFRHPLFFPPITTSQE